MNYLYRGYRIIVRPTFKYAVRSITMSNVLREEALESLKANPYFDKYSKKLFEKQKVSPEEFYSRLEEHSQQKKSTTHRAENDKKRLVPGQAKIESNIYDSKNTNTLDKILKMDLIENKTSEEVKQIWEEFHKSKEFTLSAAVPVNTYKQILRKAQEHPVFLLPLPRSQGYEFIMLQFAGNEIHFTPLISYQAHRENAPECLTIVYYPELMDLKDIILMRGEYDGKVINAMEAQCLANQLQLFYGENNEKRDNLMRVFTRSPDEFKHMDLIAEIECLSF